MDYVKIYNSLVDRAKIRNFEGFTEEHHIIPRCVGGSNNKDNLVRLTPEEHYLAHQLLIRIYPDNTSLVYAANMMICNRPSNKLYGWLRRRYIKTVSERQSGEGNSQFGTRWIFNLDLKKSRKIGKTAPLPDGWEEGRIINFNKKVLVKVNTAKKKTKKQILKDIRSKHYKIKKSRWYREAKARNLYGQFIQSGLSLRKFAESKNLVAMTLSKNFKEFIVNYNVK